MMNEHLFLLPYSAITMHFLSASGVDGKSSNRTGYSLLGALCW
jgi:hypothetical protein